MKAKRFFIFLTLILSAKTFAGNERGNGGDPACVEFMGFAKRIVSAAERRGQSHFDSRNLPIEIEKLSKVVSLLKCEPTDSLDRAARTLVRESDILTTLLRSKWEALSKSVKLALVTHEILVGAGLESEGEYQRSLDLSDDLRPLRDFLELNSRSVTYLPDNSVLIDGPFLVISDFEYGLSAGTFGDKLHAGICLFLGFKRFIGGTIAGYSPYTTTKVRIAVISEEGRVTGTPNWRGALSFFPQVQSVTCAD